MSDESTFREKTGGYAFPAGGFERGMTLRDYFAAKAMGALLSTESMLVSIQETATAKGMEIDAAVAKAAYEFADGMLAERDKQ